MRGLGRCYNYNGESQTMPQKSTCWLGKIYMSIALELLVVAINYIDIMCANYWNNWISICPNAPHHLPVHTSSSQEHTSRINRMTASGFCAA